MPFKSVLLYFTKGGHVGTVTLPLKYQPPHIFKNTPRILHLSVFICSLRLIRVLITSPCHCSLFTVHLSLFTVYYSLFTIHYSPCSIHMTIQVYNKTFSISCPERSRRVNFVNSSLFTPYPLLLTLHPLLLLLPTMLQLLNHKQLIHFTHCFLWFPKIKITKSSSIINSLFQVWLES